MTTKGRSKKPVIAHGLFSYQIGGSERIGVDLALAIKERGYRTVCFAMYDTDGPMRAQLEERGIECVDLNYETRPRLPRRVTYPLEILAFLRKHNVSHLLVHHATALVHVGIPARLAGLSHLMMVEHGLHQLKERPRYRRQAKRWCRFADSVVAVDPLIGSYFRDVMGVPERRIQYIANGVASSKLSAAQRKEVRRSLGLTADEVAIVFAGRLHPVKDLGTLIRAIAELPTAVRQNTRLLLAGTGSELQPLTELTLTLNLVDRVNFLGPRTDVRDLLGASDIFAMTSLTEGQPMAMIEAMMAGLPCVGTAVGGIPALLSPDRGITVPPQDSLAVAGALQRLLESPNLRSTLGSMARGYAEANHGIAPCVDRYLNIFGLAAGQPLA